MNQNLSDSQISDNQESTLTMDFLLHDNQIKENALSKATDLIELLKIELEVQRNSKEQSLKDLESRLHCQYQLEVEQLMNRNQFLERQLQRKNDIQNYSNRKPTRNSVRHSFGSNDKQAKKTLEPRISKMCRSTSISDMRKSREKRNTNQSQNSITTYAQRSTQKLSRFAREEYIVNPFSIQKSMVYQSLVDLQEREASWLNELGEIIACETSELTATTTNYEVIAEEAKEILKNKGKNKANPHENKLQQYLTVIREQQIAINKIKIYSRDLQEAINDMLVRLNEIFDARNGSNTILNDISNCYKDSSLNSIGEKCLHVGKQWKRKYKQLKDENLELKSILDNMIKLVREEKRMKKS